MTDQSHNVEGKIEAMIQSVNIQAAYAKALVVDRTQLNETQTAGDVVGAHRVLTDAFETDVRPLLARFRTESNLPPGSDPANAWRQPAPSCRLLTQNLGHEGRRYSERVSPDAQAARLEYARARRGARAYRINAAADLPARPRRSRLNRSSRRRSRGRAAGLQAA